MCHTLPRIGYKIPYNKNIHNNLTIMTVAERTQELINALDKDYADNSIAHHNRSILKDGDSTGYHQGVLSKIMEGTAGLNKFVSYVGRKYIKIVMQEFDDMGPSPKYEYRDSSVHAFIDKKTGDVYKPAGYNKPAKHVRFNLLDDNSYEQCIHQASWAGGYLYMR